MQPYVQGWLHVTDACDGRERACSGGGIALAHHLFDVGHYDALNI